MPQENVETIRNLFVADAEDRLAELNSWLDPEVELLGAIGGLEEGDLARGRDRVAQKMLPDQTVWASRTYDVQQIVEADDRVVAFVRERRRGRGSGVEIAADMAFIYSFNGPKISRIEPYMSQAEARAAAGLEK